MEETAEALTAAPSLIISDLDGTLLTSADRVSSRTREVIGRAVAAGARFIPASGRPARWMLPVVEQLSITPVCVCANGAVVYDAATDRITYAAELAPAVLRRVTRAILEATAAPLARMGLGPVSFAVERTGTSAFDRASELFAVEPAYPHAWDTDEHAVETRDVLLSKPAVKLLVRHENMLSADMFELVNPVVDPADAHVTWSFHGGLLEVNVPGVTKLSGLAHALGDASGSDVGVDAVPDIDPTTVVAFGDMPNDLAMLRWAGHGFAMGNAVDEVAAATDHQTASNDEDGVARVLERWF
ncbi:MAG: HAD family hydrolase [Corynebacterium variabile]|uniref:HAD family hydrolase n=1 Tax=Corynebacterium variabile TaxID=1727 RepID=UPI003F92652E